MSLSRLLTPSLRAAVNQPEHPGDPVIVTPSIESALARLKTVADAYRNPAAPLTTRELTLRRAVANFERAFNHAHPDRFVSPDTVEFTFHFALDGIARDAHTAAAIRETKSLTSARDRLFAEIDDAARHPAEHIYWTVLASFRYSGQLATARYDSANLRSAA